MPTAVPGLAPSLNPAAPVAGLSGGAPDEPPGAFARELQRSLAGDAAGEPQAALRGNPGRSSENPASATAGPRSRGTTQARHLRAAAGGGNRPDGRQAPASLDLAAAPAAGHGTGKRSRITEPEAPAEVLAALAQAAQRSALTAAEGQPRAQGQAPSAPAADAAALGANAPMLVLPASGTGPLVQDGGDTAGLEALPAATGAASRPDPWRLAGAAGGEGSVAAGLEPALDEPPPNETEAAGDAGGAPAAQAEPKHKPDARRLDGAATRRTETEAALSPALERGPADGAAVEAAAGRPKGKPADPAMAPNQPPAAFAADLARSAEALARNGDAAPAAGAALREVQLPVPVHAAGFLPRLGEEVAVLVRDGVHEARLQVHPAEMGPITVQVQLDGTQAQVQLGVDNATTRSLLESAMPALAAALHEQGLTLSGGGVFQQSRRRADGDAQPRGAARAAADDAEAPRAAAAAPRRHRLGAVDLYA